MIKRKFVKTEIDGTRDELIGELLSIESMAIRTIAEATETDEESVLFATIVMTVERLKKKGADIDLVRLGISIIGASEATE